MKYITLFTLLLLAGISVKSQDYHIHYQDAHGNEILNSTSNYLPHVGESMGINGDIYQVDSLYRHPRGEREWFIKVSKSIYDLRPSDDDSIYVWGRNKIKIEPKFDQIVFLLQQSKELSDRLDRLEKTVDSLERDHAQLWGINKFNTRYGIEMYDSLTARIDSLERRPYLFMDYKSKPFPQLIAKCPDGSCELIIESYK